MKHISPEHIQNFGANQEAADTHPQAVCERGQRERDDEVWEEGRHEDDQRFAGEQVEEEPHYPCEEGAGRWAEIVEPVGDDGEDERDED